MNEFNKPANTSNVPWPTSGDLPERAHESPAMHGSDSAGPAAVDLLKSGEQSAHDTIDRLVDRAEPAVRQMGEDVSAAKDKLRVKTEQLREKRDEWVEGARSTVRGNPLVALAAALALGAVFARLTR